MQKLFRTLHDTIAKGEAAVIAMIIASEGSTPRTGGAAMIVTKDGRIAGTIGGGAVEFNAETLAKKCVETKTNARESFMLCHNETADIGMICGGSVTVLFSYVEAGDEYILSLTEKIEEQFANGSECRIIAAVDKMNKTSFSLYSCSQKLYGDDIPEEIIKGFDKGFVAEKSDDMEFYSNQLVTAGRVFVFGGGHVSQQLVPLLARCDFRCIVVEDRPEFAQNELFEERAADIRLIDMDKVGDLAKEITSDDYVCIMTRGHKDDYLVQKEILRTKACYIGVIGSKKKIAGINAKLTADGFSKSDLERITTPIGLEIYAETPAEIAVSIAAQMIAVRAKLTGGRKYLEAVKQEQNA